MTAVSEKRTLTEEEKHELVMRTVDRIIRDDKTLLDKLAKL
jgi:hypothetical protein